jgi:hypothetical protein
LESHGQRAIDALPGISGAIVSMIDNEASFCDAGCPRCNGRSLEAGIADIYSTFCEIADQRQGGLKVAMYDWWLPARLVEQVPAQLPGGSLIIGRSARGIPFTALESSWTGHITDIRDGALSWHARHPAALGNPCHHLLGHFCEAWPDADFSADIFGPKEKSLLFLRDAFDSAELVPSYVIQGKRRLCQLRPLGIFGGI